MQERCNSSAWSYVFLALSHQYNRNTLWLRDRVKQASWGKSAAARPTTPLLTSWTNVFSRLLASISVQFQRKCARHPGKKVFKHMPGDNELIHLLSQVPGTNGVRCQGQKIPPKLEVNNITAAHYVTTSLTGSILTTYYRANMSLFYRLKDFTYVHNLSVEKESKIHL